MRWRTRHRPAGPPRVGRRVLRRHRPARVRSPFPTGAAVLPAHPAPGPRRRLGRSRPSRRDRHRRQRRRPRGRHAPRPPRAERGLRERRRAPQRLAPGARALGVRARARIRGGGVPRAGHRDLPRARRRRRWLVVVVLGVLAGASRPSGFIVALPIAIEAVRTVRAAPVTERLRALAATASPFVGAALVPRVGRRPVRRRAPPLPGPDPRQPQGVVHQSPLEHHGRGRRSVPRPHRHGPPRAVDDRRRGARDPRVPAAPGELRRVRGGQRGQRGDLGQPRLVRALRARRVPDRDRRRVAAHRPTMGDRRDRDVVGRDDGATPLLRSRTPTSRSVPGPGPEPDPHRREEPHAASQEDEHQEDAREKTPRRRRRRPRRRRSRRRRRPRRRGRRPR